jgi:long-chain acyl-CoA synthetase
MQEKMQSSDLNMLGQSVAQLLQDLPERISAPVRRWQKDRPNAIALCDPQGTQCSYAELGLRVDACKDLLRAHGVGAGDRVLLINENCIAVLVWILALSEIDAVNVVVNARLAEPEITRIRQHCEPRLTVFFLDSSAAQVHWAELRELGDSAQVMQSEASLGLLQGRAGAPLDERDRPVSDRVCTMIYTTGTTGDPKGVMLSHRNILYVAAVTSVLRGMTKEDRIYCVLPISHIFGLSAVFLATLFLGAELVLADRFDAASSLRTLQEKRVTGMMGVPTMFARIIEYARANDLSRDDMPRLRFLYSGGSPLDATIKRDIEQLLGLTLLNAYGMTESGPTICQVRWNEKLDNCSVGRPLPGLTLRVLGADGKQVPLGEVGELHVRGPNVMRGYYKNPEATAAVIDDEGFLNTGDLVRLDEAGNVHIAGRSKELIIHSGFNVYPPEVEAAIAKHPDVVLCAVIGEVMQGNEHVIAYVQRKAGSTLTESALQAFLKPSLSPYKRPATIIFMPQLPTAPSGKVLKHQLRGVRNA